MFLKIMLASAAALALGLWLRSASGGGCGTGMSGCGMAGMSHDQQAAAPTTAPAEANAGMSCCGMAGMSHAQQAAAPTTAPAGSAPATTQPATQPALVYTCPMHPEVTSDKPGKCPKCGMSLQIKKD